MLRNTRAGRRVLVVEDDEAIVRMLQMSLRSGGFSPERAGSGQEAIDALDASVFDAVVLDLCLPDGRGADVLEKLRTNGHSPVWIAMSALDEYEAIRRFGPLKGPFLAKPFDPWDLTRLLDRLLMQGRGNSERQLGAAAS